MDVELTQETTEEAPEQAPEAASSATATRDDLIAAAQEASKSDPDTEQGEKPAPVTEEEPRWQQIIKAREKAQAERDAAKSYADEAKRRAEEEAKAIVEAAKKQAAEEVAAERARWKDRFQHDPEGALQELGDGEAVAAKLIDLNTPHGKAIAKLQAELAEAKRTATDASKVREEFETFKNQQKQAAEQSQYETAKNAFLSTFATAEKTPYLHARYDTDELVAKATSVAREWTEAKVQFDLKDIAEYLEADAKKRLSALGIQPAQQSGAGAREGQGIATKSAANGSRGITAASGSERRASPKAFHEMTPEEQREDLIREVQKVYRAHGKP